jgi:hypothetical protein
LNAEAEWWDDRPAMPDRPLPQPDTTPLHPSQPQPTQPQPGAAPALDVRPGLAKVRQVEAVLRRRLELVSIRDGWWSAVIERADVVSEGGSVCEAGAMVYYGSSSLRCVLDAAAIAGADTSEAAEQLLTALLSDAHARLRILRLAHREAVVRAGGPIHALHAEIRGRVMHEGERMVLAIDVDVSADEAVLSRDAM